MSLYLLLAVILVWGLWDVCQGVLMVLWGLWTAAFGRVP